MTDKSLLQGLHSALHNEEHARIKELEKLINETLQVLIQQQQELKRLLDEILQLVSRGNRLGR